MRTACVVMGRAESLLLAHYLSEDASLREGRMRQLIRSCVTEELRSRLVLTDDVWPCMSLQVTSPPTGGCCVRGQRPYGVRIGHPVPHAGAPAGAARCSFSGTVDRLLYARASCTWGPG